ncbi:MAG: archaeosortase/exosortase family protein [Bacteroidetes bacterium]|nr:archaeosortase/exosortase family protein [Bacteroidota bacterium]
MKKIHENIIAVFIAKFSVLFTVSYAFDYAMTGITVPGGYYNEWIDNHFNYVAFLRTLILKSAGFVVHHFGFDYTIDQYHLRIPNVSTVKMVFSCIGTGILCFWWAFVLSFPQPAKSKARYLLVGTLVIVLLNILRVAGLVMIRSVNSMKHTKIDHHLIFNIVVYVLIFLMIVRIVDKLDKKPLQ